MANVFDQFDAPTAPAAPTAAPSGNVFDQFDAAPASAPASAAAQSPGVLDTVNHWAGLANRALIGGAAGLPSELAGIVQGAGEEVADKLGYHPAPAQPANTAPYSPQLSDFVHPEKWQQAAEYFADHALGTPQPQTAGERVFTRAVQSLPSAALTPEAPVAGALSAAAGGAASQAVAEGGGSPREQLAAGLAAGGVSGIGAGVAGVARAAARGGEAGRLAVQQSIDDFANAGATPTVGQATGSRVIQGTEKTIGALPGGAKVMDAAAATQRAGLSDRLDDIVSNLSGGQEATPTTAGSALQTAGKNTIAAVRADSKAAYGAVDKVVPPSTGIDVSNTAALVQRLTTPTPGAEATTGSLILPKLKALADNLQTDIAASGGKLPYSAASALKSALGDQIDWSPFPTDPANAQLKQVYNSLRADIDVGASQVSPQAAQAVRAASAQYAANKAKLDALQSIVDRNGGPEAVFNAALSGTGPKGGATIVNQALGAMDSDQRQLFAAAVLRRMGTASPGAQGAAGDAFNADQFLTNWNKMNPASKSAIFGGVPLGYQQNLDAFARAVETIKNSGNVLKNSSGTAAAAAHSLWLADMLSSVPMLVVAPHVAVGQLASGAAIAGGADIAARVLTSPKAVAWLAKQTRIPTSPIAGAVAAAATAGHSGQ